MTNVVVHLTEKMHVMHAVVTYDQHATIPYVVCRTKTMRKMHACLCLISMTLTMHSGAHVSKARFQ